MRQKKREMTYPKRREGRLNVNHEELKYQKYTLVAAADIGHERTLQTLTVKRIH